MNTNSNHIIFKKLDEIIQTGASNLNIDCKHLRQFRRTQRMYTQLLRYPQEIIPLMDLVVNQERAVRRQVHTICSTAFTMLTSNLINFLLNCFYYFLLFTSRVATMGWR